MTVSQETSEYDYVVVGAGSAGCVVAARLSEDPATTVLLLEAGGSDEKVDAINIPAAFASLFKTEYDWDYTTEGQKHLLGRSVYWPRGRVLGGSSSMNAMIYIRGSKVDYDSWAARGCDGWSYDEVLPLFRRAEDNVRGASHYHGAGGPLHVDNQRSPHRFTQAFLQSAQSYGLAPNDDFNGDRQEGTGLYQVTQKKGRRFSTARAFLRPAMARPNLSVETGALVHRVVIENGRATGVEYRRQGVTRVARVGREAVLCGGAINSPQVLMLSGVGPAHHLREHGIDVVADSPGVGENLHDHPGVGVSVLSRDKISLLAAESMRQMVAFYSRGRGMLTSNVGEGGAFLHTRDGLPAADMQYHFVPSLFLDEGLTEPIGHGYTLACTLVAVQSRGRLTLRGPHPAWKPVIDAGYMSSDVDMDAMVAGLKIAREILAQPAMARHDAGEHLPGASVTDDEGLREHVRATLQSLYHPVGTCSMGPDSDPMAVVDPQLRVRGVEGLRVADASVMPEVPRGNTNAPSIMVGERCADLVRGLASPAKVAVGAGA